MGEKKRRLSTGTVALPHQRELIAQAFRALQQGDRDGARSKYIQLFGEAPGDAESMDRIGILALRLGDLGNAEKMLRLAVATQPKAAGYRCNLAIVLRHLGQNAQAIEQLQHALLIDPGLVEAHTSLGNALMDARRFNEAAAAFEQALTVRRDYADALYGLANAQLALDRREEGCANLERAVAVDPSFHEAHATLAAARMDWAAELARMSPDNGAPAEEQARIGVNSIALALQVCPDNPLYWVQFSEFIQKSKLRYPLSGLARDLLMRALDHPILRPSSMVRAIVGLVHSHPAAIELTGLLSSSGVPGNLQSEKAVALAGVVLGDPLLLKLLTDLIVPDVFLERLVGLCRSAILREAVAMSAPSLPVEVIVALAHRGFSTEYACEESPGDAALVDALAQRLNAPPAPDEPRAAHWYAIYAAFRPLHSLARPEQIVRALADTPFRELAVRQISEPAEERALVPTIAEHKRAMSDVSLAVRAQYEANPYPRWIRPVRLLQSGSVRQTMQVLFPLADFSQATASPPRILIAGCGTGQHPIDTAQRFRDASVLAIDLSMSSLAYAKRKARELGITNIEFRQADILELGSLDERFDVIECAGVLHHLKEPLAGWRVLCGLLRPQGVMRIALYSEIARRFVVHAREFIKVQGYEATAEGIRRCRAAILAHQDDVRFEKLARSEDFYSMSGCRDLIFHVQEHRYTLPRIAAELDALSLRFLGFELPDPGVALDYRSRFPEDAGLTNLDSWHLFERDHPDTFFGMYQFWVRAKAADPGAIGQA
jgi:2-polyprenyl-3-methyl-5-hydroxy-6-metoxy-1,4-benzoquinol methylase/tetratricopeptide (TPR) repeat protein